jgi:hypothetical protein
MYILRVLVDYAGEARPLADMDEVLHVGFIAENTKSTDMPNP